MSKSSVLWIILALLVLVVFNAIFFLVTEGERATAVWISYGFIHLAFGLLVATPILTRKDKGARLFGLPLPFISAGYFLLAFVAGIVFIIMSPEDLQVLIVVQLIIAVLYAIILTAKMIMIEHKAKDKHEPAVKSESE